jgi:uncharacterized protein YlaI
MRTFRTEHRFASWLFLCPDNETSAGKVLRRRSQNRFGYALRMAASSLHRGKSPGSRRKFYSDQLRSSPESVFLCDEILALSSRTAGKSTSKRSRSAHVNMRA